MPRREPGGELKEEGGLAHPRLPPEQDHRSREEAPQDPIHLRKPRREALGGQGGDLREGARGLPAPPSPSRRADLFERLPPPALGTTAQPLWGLVAALPAAVGH